ncbi:hypothetical protein CEXT_197081 [Caerostris extrusa]|uniref:Uncharacterized protein n=1 Tax=Caerostris extrusa TaxID=172846 RepID=A0AAV4QQF8_CAEEX|nr:hypothetical protein CEXT_197081 [Caerostris extrusa]
MCICCLFLIKPKKPGGRCSVLGDSRKRICRPCLAKRSPVAPEPTTKRCHSSKLTGCESEFYFLEGRFPTPIIFWNASECHTRSSAVPVSAHAPLLSFFSFSNDCFSILFHRWRRSHLCTGSAARALHSVEGLILKTAFLFTSGRTDGYFFFFVKMIPRQFPIH